LSELGSESAKIKAMGIMDKLSTDKTVKVLNILEKNIQDGSKLSTLLNHVSLKCHHFTPLCRVYVNISGTENINEYVFYFPGGVLSSKAKRAKCSTHKQRVIVMLYNKVCDIVSSLSELLEIQLLTDTTILQVSSMGITPFFVENVSELQLCAIKLVTAVSTS
ncbi:NIPBL protein, partial [Panurus biarmicus]|nr:NIPBL protein [Panurus biarmicus]